MQMMAPLCIMIAEKEGIKQMAFRSPAPPFIVNLWTSSNGNFVGRWLICSSSLTPLLVHARNNCEISWKFLILHTFSIVWTSNWISDYLEAWLTQITQPNNPDHRLNQFFAWLSSCHRYETQAWKKWHFKKGFVLSPKKMTYILL